MVKSPSADETISDGASRGTLALVALAIIIPFAIYAGLAFVSPAGAPPEARHGASIFPASPILFEHQQLSASVPHAPRITNVKIADLDQDKLPDLIVCDALQNRVLWYRQFPRGQWTEKVLADNLPAPAHSTVVDIDKDGDLDILISVLGSVWPTDTRVGRVVLLKNDGRQNMTAQVILDDLLRVSDVQAGDLDGDGDVDLVVAVFGFLHGQVLWLENRGDGTFRDHLLLAAPGCIHVPVLDFDQDGDLDIITIVSQDEEQLIAFENVTKGKFEPKIRVLYDTVNFDLGSAGLVATDLDRDGDADLLLVAGDNLDALVHYPQPWHGCIWFENKGNWKFEAKRLAHFGGAYGVAAGDIDGDKDIDVVLVSMFNDWDRKGAASVIWLENDGKQNFRPWQVADAPIYLATVDCGDLNGDGYADIVAGGLSLSRGTDRRERLPIWITKPKK